MRHHPPSASPIAALAVSMAHSPLGCPLVPCPGGELSLPAGLAGATETAVALAPIAPRADVARLVTMIAKVSTTVGAWLHGREAASTERPKPAILGPAGGVVCLRPPVAGSVSLAGLQGSPRPGSFPPYSHLLSPPSTRACGARMMLLRVISPFLTAEIAPFQIAADNCPLFEHTRTTNNELWYQALSL